MPERWSLAVIARDEQDRIAGCLASVPADWERVVVLDPRTRDDTAAYARAAGARVLERPFDAFDAQRNAALDATTGGLVLFLDADERLGAEARAALAQLPDDVCGVRFPIASRWLGTRLRHGRWFPNRKVRAVRRGRGRWAGAVHERLAVDGRVLDCAGALAHDPYRDWTEHVAAIRGYTAAQRVGRRAPWPLEAPVRASLHFVDAAIARGGWRDGAAGLAVAGLGAAAVWAKWSR